MEKILYKLENFEGPLDLLLHLIQKNKVSIYDIPIVEITNQYLEAIQDIEESQLENTSEFLVMAAQLLYIKSKMLLPKDTEEDEEDPREDLSKRLEEYQRYKNAASELRKKEFSAKYLFFREIENIAFPIPPYEHHHKLSELTQAIDDIYERRMMRQPPQKRAFVGIVGREKVSVDAMVEKVRSILREKKRIGFQSVFKKTESKPEKIATFLAILEMIKFHRISADYDELQHDFIITRRKDDKT